MNYTINLNGNEIIELKPINTNFLCSASYNNWINDLEVNEYSSLCRFPVTEKDKKQLLIDMENRKSIHWSISHKDYQDARPYYIGTVSLQEIDISNRSAELAIKIGETDYWGKGIGYNVCNTIISHGFHRLNLHRIRLGTLKENIAMISLAEKLNMFFEGNAKHSFFSDNKFHDVCTYAILSN